MRWDELFADLEGQLATALDRESAGLDLEEERLRLARLSMRERLVALGSGARSGLAMQLRNGETLHLLVRSSGRDWLAGTIARSPASAETDLAKQRSVVVPDWAIATIALDPAAVPESISVPGAEQLSETLAARLGLAFVLRELCRRRVLVELDTLVGQLIGTIDRVGRDHLDLAEHEPGVPRRASAVRRIRIVAFSALLAVRSRAG